MVRFLVILVVIFVSFFSVFSEAQTWLDRPESVAFDSLRNRYLVSTIGGSVVALDTTGIIQDTFLTIEGMCYGNCIAGDSFYVSNGTNIFGINMSTEEIFMDVTMPTAARSYDGMTTDTSGNLYVVYTGGMIFKIRLSDHTYSPFVLAGLAPSPQDIIFDARNNRLLIAGYSANAPIQVVYLPDSSISNAVYTGVGYFDGITIDHIGNVYLGSHNNGGGIYKYDKTLTNPPELIFSDTYQPAGLDYNWRDNVLGVPDFGHDELILIPLTFSPDLDSYQFSDVTGGDGDGRLENGETIELVVTLINYRTQPVTDINVGLTIDDATISVIDGGAFMGSAGAMDTLDNAGDPLEFSIPSDYDARIDSFFIEFSYNGGSEIDTFVIEQSLGMPKILLVDDDEYDNIEDYYLDCLLAARIPCDIWSAPPAPASGDLGEYELVIWFTGDFRLPLDEDEILAMTGYFDAGGNLFLTGQGIAALLDMIDQTFMNDYLKADYLLTQLVPVLASEPGAQVFDASDSVWLSGTGGASNQTDTDHLAAVNGGVGEMSYVGVDGLGAVSYAGVYKSLFFGFGFEAIINGHSRWTDRHTILSRILDFFEFQRPGLSPAVEGPDIIANDPMYVTDHNPDFSWTFADPGFLPQEICQIQVGVDDDWSSAEMWDSGPVYGSESQATYAGAPLQDGEYYYVRIRASNGALWSPWISLTIRMNSIPSPTGLIPDNLQEVTDDAVILTHDNLPDNEEDDLTYAYEIYNDNLLTELVTSVSGQAAGSEATSSWTPSISLTTYEDYYWRVRSDDGHESGPWIGPASFFVIPAYICGDGNGDEQVNVGDAVFLIAFVFSGGTAPDPVCAGNANGDDQTNVADAVYLINYVFKGGSAPSENCCQ
jgi:hypothetical protein